MSNSLDPDQARRFVGPDLGPNCLPRSSADDTGRQRVDTVLVLMPESLTLKANIRHSTQYVFGTGYSHKSRIMRNPAFIHAKTKAQIS